jgi:hypothetical protein
MPLPRLTGAIGPDQPSGAGSFASIERRWMIVVDVKQTPARSG